MARLEFATISVAVVLVASGIAGAASSSPRATTRPNAGDSIEVAAERLAVTIVSNTSTAAAAATTTSPAGGQSFISAIALAVKSTIANTIASAGVSPTTAQAAMRIAVVTLADSIMAAVISADPNAVNPVLHALRTAVDHAINEVLETIDAAGSLAGSTGRNGGDTAPPTIAVVVYRR